MVQSRIRCLLVVGILLGLSSLLGHAEGQTCRENHDYETLANILISTTNIKYQLSIAFFPTERAPPAFVKVIYHYNDTEIANQTWLWSSGTFYFFQPLRIFQYTSLFFGNPEFRVGNVTLMLPADCANAPVPVMETLTQRLKLIASSQKAYPEITDKYQAKAANAETVTQSFYKHDGYDIVALVHIVQVLLPITSCVIFIVCFVYYWVKIAGSRQYQHLTDTDWSTVAAYYGVSLYFTLYAFSLDCVAVNHRRVGAEFIRDNEFIKNFVYAPFALDFVAVVIIAGLFLIPYFGRCCHCTMSEYTKWQFVCLSLAGLAPFFCIISHAHFIVIAWITDPAYASGIGAFYGFLVVVYFLIFKFVYHQCNHLLLSIYCYNTLVETTVSGHLKLQGHLRTLQRTTTEVKVHGMLEVVEDNALYLHPEIKLEEFKLDEDHNISDGKVTGKLTIRGEPKQLTLNLEEVQFVGKLETSGSKVTFIKGTLDRKGDNLSGTIQGKPPTLCDRICRFCLKRCCFTGSTCACFCYGATDNVEDPGLSFAALLIMLAAGLFLTGYFGMIACFFILIPITKSIEDTPTQAYAIYQGIIVVLTALLAYVVIVKPGSFSITTAVKTAIKGIKEAEGKKIKDDWMKIGDEERLAGVIAKTVTDHILKEAPEQDEQAQDQQTQEAT